MSRALPYYKMYPGDAETDENFRAMSDEELGYYWRCLNHAWLNNGLPSDPKERSRTFKLSPRKEAQLWLRVGRCFRSFGVEGRIFNARQESERTKAILKSERATQSVRTRYERSTNESPRAVTRAESVSVYGSESESSEPEKEKPKVSVYGKLDPVLDELEAIYLAAGRPIAPRHRQLCAQYFTDIAADKWPQVAVFVRHALATIWRDPTKTKSLVNLLRDGDWDVPIVERSIPPPANGTRHSALDDIIAEERAKRA